MAINTNIEECLYQRGGLRRISIHGGSRVGELAGPPRDYSSRSGTRSTTSRRGLESEGLSAEIAHTVTAMRRDTAREFSQADIP